MPFVSSGGTLTEVARPTVFARPSSIVGYTGISRTYEALYRAQPNVRFVVDFVARNIADLPIRLMRLKSERERIHDRDHPFDRFLRNPSPVATRYTVIRDLVTDWLIHDWTVALKIQVNGRRALLRRPPSTIEPVGGGDYPSGFRLLTSPGQPIWPADRVFALHGYAPEGGPIGVSPIETLRRILAEGDAAAEYREQFWRNGSRHSAVIQRPTGAPKWTDDAKLRFETGFSATWAGRGPGAGGTPVLEDGMTLEKTGFSAQEAEYLGARKLERAECAAAWFTDPAMIGLLDGANIANVDDRHTILYQDGLGPALTFLALEFWLQLLPDFVSTEDERDELEVEFGLEHKLRGSFSARIEATTRAVGAPWMTRAEGRAQNGLPPLDEDQGADDLVVPLNVTTGGLPNPVDTRLPFDEDPTGDQALQELGRGPAGTKALGGAKALQLPNLNAGGWVDQHVSALTEVIDAQEASFRSRIGAGYPVTEAFRGRAGQFSDVLVGLASALAPDATADVADRFGIEYDVDRATDWLRASAAVAVDNFNAATLQGLISAYATPTGTLSRAASMKAEVVDDEELTPLDEALAVFATARTRLGPFSQDRVTTAANFARQDCAQQAGATTKTWRVTSTRPRASHAELNGVTIPADQAFANGLLWPHDPTGGAAENARCTCYVDFTEAPVTEET